ncbi:MAG: ATP-binding protein [Candidatus Hydrogenedentota bacterium]
MKKLIHIVDDEPHIREFLDTLLKEEYKVKSSPDANHALKELFKEAPDIMLLDIRLPGMNGMELLKKIIGIAPQIAVIMVTAVKDTAVSREAIKIGAYDYIVKPFDIDNIKIVITRALNHIELLNNHKELMKSIIIYKDTIERERKIKLEALYKLYQILKIEFDMEKMLELGMELLRDTVLSEATSLLLYEYKEGNKTLVFKYATGPKRDKLLGISLNDGEGIVGDSAKNDISVYVADAQSDPRFARRIDEITGFVTRSVICVPLKLENKVIGVIEILNKINEESFNEDDFKLATMITEQIGLIMERRKFQEILKREVETATQNLRELTSKHEAVISSIAEGIVVINNDYKIITFNQMAEKITGYSKEEAIEKSCKEVFFHEHCGLDVCKSRCIFGKVLETGMTMINYEIQMVNKRKPPTPLLINAAPLFDSTSIQIGCVTIFQDISKLKEVDRMKSDFIALVSHELRTPMAAIKGSTDLILKQKLGPLNQEQIKLLNIASNNVNRLVRLVNELLDLSKIEAGELTIEKKSFIFSEILSEVIEILDQRIKKKNISIKTTIPDDLPPIYADPDGLKQVLINIIGNSIKFIQKRGKIIITTIKKDKEIVFKIQDNGPGIPSNDLPYIFDKFYRAKNSYTKKSGGAGLGLAIAKSIIEAHKGNITATSEEDKGASFTFTLPVEIEPQ